MWVDHEKLIFSPNWYDENSLIAVSQRLQVFPNAFDQQTGHRIYRSRNVRVEHVPATVLGLLPSGRLFPQTVRRGARRRRRRLIIVFLCLIGPGNILSVVFYYAQLFLDHGCIIVIVRGHYYYYFYYKSLKYYFAVRCSIFSVETYHIL